jgi:hypothetical protein
LDGEVVVGLAVVGAEVVEVLDGGGVAFEGGAGLVERVRPGEGVEEGEAGGEALLVAYLEGVVVGGELVEGGGDVRELGVGAVGLGEAGGGV